MIETILEKRITNLDRMSDSNVGATLNLALKEFDSIYKEKRFDDLNKYCHYISDIAFEIERRQLLDKYNKR